MMICTYRSSEEDGRYQKEDRLEDVGPNVTGSIVGEHTAEVADNLDYIRSQQSGLDRGRTDRRR
jgi:hypothetical protein